MDSFYSAVKNYKFWILFIVKFAFFVAFAGSLFDIFAIKYFDLKFISIFVCDLSVTAKGFTAISFFSKKDFLFDDIKIMSIENWGTRSFQVYTTVRNFTFAYTKSNYAALKEIIPLVKYSKISVEELEAMVKKAFFAPS